MAILCSTALGSRSSLADTLERIRKLGFSGVDLLAIEGWVHISPVELTRNYEQVVQRIENLLDQYGLTIGALNTGVSPQLHDRTPKANRRRRRETESLVRLMNHFGVKVAAIQPRQPDPNRPKAEAIRACVESLAEQQQVAARSGVLLVLEPHVGSPAGSLDDIASFLNLLPDLRIVYDPSHFIMQGIPLRKTEWLLEQVAHVHLRSAAVGQMQAPFQDGIPYLKWVLAALRDRSYTGDISIEYLETADFDVDDAVRRTADLVQEILG